MIAAATFQHIWKCIELRLNHLFDRIFFLNAVPSNSIYKWIAFSLLCMAVLPNILTSTSIMASDIAAMEMGEDVALTDSLQQELQYDASAISCNTECEAAEVWEISTRQLPQSGWVAPLDVTKYRVTRWLPSCGWIESSIEQYLASVRGDEKSNDGNVASNSLHNIVYVHGNWMPADSTRDRGLLISRYLAQRAHFPFRLTIFSWPSTREKRALADIRENAVVAEVQGLYLGTLLQQFPQEKPLGIIGFSYGARAVTGSLHALGGGTLCGRTLNEGTYPNEIRVSLMAAAIDRGWLLQGGRHQNASQAISSLVNLYNSNDPILRRYHLISSSSRATAAGVAGIVLPRNWLNLPPAEGTAVAAPSSLRLRQFDCRSDLGRSHDERSYYRECSCTVHLMDHVLWNDWNELHASNNPEAANESAN